MRKIRTSAFIKYLKIRANNKTDKFKISHTLKNGDNKRICMISIETLMNKVKSNMITQQDHTNKNLFKVVVDEFNYYDVNLRR